MFLLFVNTERNTAAHKHLLTTVAKTGKNSKVDFGKNKVNSSLILKGNPVC